MKIDLSCQEKQIKQDNYKETHGTIYLAKHEDNKIKSVSLMKQYNETRET